MDSALHQLQARLDAQGFDALPIAGDLVVLAPATDDGAPRLADVIACMSRPDDSGRPWLYVNGRELEPATHIIDAAMRIGARLTVKAGH